jgi:hypothetical protein
MIRRVYITADQNFFGVQSQIGFHRCPPSFHAEYRKDCT